MRLKEGITLSNAGNFLPKGFHSVMTQNNYFNYHYKRKHRKLKLQVSCKYSEFVHATYFTRRDYNIPFEYRRILIRPMNWHERPMTDIIQIKPVCEQK